MKPDSKIFVAGHRGLVGSALVRRLEHAGYRNLVLRTHAELDLEDQGAVKAFFAQEKPEYVVLAAAKVGGIHANNTYPAQFVYRNLAIQNNVIHESYRNGVDRLLFLGSSCIYPKFAEQPMKTLATPLLSRRSRVKPSGARRAAITSRQPASSGVTEARPISWRARASVGVMPVRRPCSD